jgi:hypothetical protein
MKFQQEKINYLKHVSRNANQDLVFMKNRATRQFLGFFFATGPLPP